MSLASSPPPATPSPRNLLLSKSPSTPTDPSRIPGSPLRKTWADTDNERSSNGGAAEEYRNGGKENAGTAAAGQDGQATTSKESDGFTEPGNIPKKSLTKKRRYKFLPDLHRDRKSSKPQSDGAETTEQSRPVYTHKRGESAVANVAIRAGGHDGSASGGQNQNPTKGKGRPLSHASQESSTLASSSGRSRPSHEQDSSAHGQLDGQAPAIDPTQIVQMALNLSENRRMQRMPGTIATQVQPGSRKVTPANLNVPRPRDMLSGSYGGRGASMRQAMQDHQRNSRNSSPTSRKSDSPRRRPSSSFPPFAANIQLDIEGDIFFSPGTLARAQKARDYFELAHQYRRLLEFLPPLAASPPTNGPSRMSYDRSRNYTTPEKGESSGNQRVLGRAYNPLQYIRNRKVRARERDRLEAQADGWDDVNRVGAWVDAVAAYADNQDHLKRDEVVLPKWRSAQHSQDVPEGETPTTAASAATKAPKLPKLEWHFVPENMLADAYWVEQGSNKALLETRDGHRLLPHRRYQRTRPESPGSRPLSRADVIADDYASPTSWTASKSPDSPNHPYTESDDDGPVSVSGSLPRKARAGKMARLLRRKRATSGASEFLSNSDDETTEGLGRYRRHAHAENTGPLHKHMNQILQNEHRHLNGQHDHEHNSHGRNAHESGHRRRHGISGSQDGSPTVPPRLEVASKGSIASNSEPNSAPPVTSGDSNSSKGDLSKSEPVSAPPVATLEAITEQDTLPSPTEATTPMPVLRAPDTDDKSKPAQPIEQPNPEQKRTRGASVDRFFRHRNHKQSLSVNTLPPAVELAPTEQKQEREKSPVSSTTRRLFKGGRVKELVHSEAGSNAKKRTKREERSAPSTRPPSIDGSSANTSASGERLGPADRPAFDEKELSRSFKRHSIASSTKPTEMNSRLPSFKHLNGRDDVSRKFRDFMEGDLSLRQQIAARRRRRSTQSRGVQPPALKINDESPSSSNPDLSRYTTGDLADAGSSDKRDSVMSDSLSRSSTGVRDADRRLNKILRQPGAVGVGLSGLPMTGLAALEARVQDNQRDKVDSLDWNDAAHEHSRHGRHSSITHKDLTYITTLLLASGVKAKGIERNANSFRGYFPKFLEETARMTNSSLTRVPRKQEHVVAAKMLSSHLEDNINEFEATAEVFTTQTCARLHSQIRDLREQANHLISETIDRSGNAAEAFVKQLRRGQTKQVKDVNDGIDMMMRNRRARLRWVRGSMFKMLEWFVVGLLWVIWLIVLVLKIFKITVVGTYRGIKWLFWIS